VSPVCIRLLDHPFLGTIDIFPVVYIPCTQMNEHLTIGASSGSIGMIGGICSTWQGNKETTVSGI
jgi:hypothetical protein